MERGWATVDGTELCARIAYRLSDVIAMYPITPSSGMAMAADAWSAAQRQIQRRLAPCQELAGRIGGAA